MHGTMHLLPYRALKLKQFRSTNKVHIILKPNETRTLVGLVRNPQLENAVTENTPIEDSFNVCPRLVAVKPNAKTARIPVKTCNISARPITIKPKSQLCDLHEVKVIENSDPTRIVFLQKNRCLPPFCCQKYQNVPK